MKILQINVALNSGSTGKIAEQIGISIQNEGFESFIAYSRSGLPSASHAIKIGSKKDIYKHVLYTRLFDKHGLASKMSTINLITEVDKICPDLIHLHNIHGYYLNFEELFKYLNNKNIPVVWTFHDCWPFTGHCSYFERVNCEKWKTACFECPMKSYYPASWFLDNSRNNFNIKKKYFTENRNLTIVTPSKWLKTLVQQSFFSEYQVKVIHNGIDLSIFTPKRSTIKNELKIQSSKILLGVASIWDKRKGLDDFLLLNELLDKNFQMILVGLSKKQQLKLPANIIGIGRTENVDKLVELYSLADVYINPTYSDNFPTTNIEALACGTPVITYNTGGSPEAIDEHTGIVVKKGNIEGIKDAVETIINSKNSYTLEYCRERAINNFDKNTRFKDYLDLYRALDEN